MSWQRMQTHVRFDFCSKVKKIDCIDFGAVFFFLGFTIKISLVITLNIVLYIFFVFCQDISYIKLIFSSPTRQKYKEKVTNSSFFSAFLFAVSPQEVGVHGSPLPPAP